MDSGKFVVYSVFTGYADGELNDPFPLNSSGFERICFTNDMSIDPKSWKLVFLDTHFLDSARASRLPKILPHRYLPDFEWSLYIDNSVKFKRSPVEIFRQYALDNKTYWCTPHPFRDCIYDEAEDMIRLGYDDEKLVREQIGLYRNFGHPAKFGLVANGVLLRKHNIPDIIHFNEIWFQHVLRFSKRDQISFPFLARQFGFEYHLFDLNLQDNPFWVWPGFKQQSHNANLHLAGRPSNGQMKFKEVETQQVLGSIKFDLEEAGLPNRQYHLLKLIPRGSQREKLVCLLFKVLRLWKNAGILALGKKVKDRLKLISHYQQWILDNETDPKTLLTGQETDKAFQAHPLISIVMPVYNPPLEYLDEAIRSVRAQSYPYFELCIADDASPDSRVRTLIEKHAREDIRIRYIFREVNGHISEASNSALEMVTGKYFALLDHDDKLHPLALYYVAQEIVNHPNAEVIYSDEDKLDQAGKRTAPYFKTDFNYDLLLSQNMISHLGVYKTATVRNIGGFRVGLDGSQDYDLVLRIIEHIKPHQIYHIPRVLYHWRISNRSTAADANEKPYAYAAARRAITEHLERKGVDASVEIIPRISSYRVKYSLPEPHPLVKIIIYPRKQSDMLRGCINSLLAKTKYDNYGVSLIITEPITAMDRSWLEQLDKEHSISILHNESKISRARFINQIVADSKTDYICILDEKIQEFSTDWLSELLAHIVQPGVGVVGPKILSSNATVYSGGMVLGIGEISDNLFFDLPVHDPGYFGWAELQRSITILSSECFVVKKSQYLDVGGLGDKLVSYDYMCIDFFLKLRDKGLRNIYTPFSQIVYRTQNPVASQMEPDRMNLKNDQEYMKIRWKAWIDHDPSFNPNLDLKNGQIVLARHPRMN